LYDYFEIIGVPPDAGAQAIRRAEGRRRHGLHPDFGTRETSGDEPERPMAAALAPDRDDAALDFVDMTFIVARLQAAFFAGT
jgi:hypothetical protein